VTKKKGRRCSTIEVSKVLANNIEGWGFCKNHRNKLLNFNGVSSYVHSYILL
jgi:hypothetical protein